MPLKLIRSELGHGILKPHEASYKCDSLPGLNVKTDSEQDMDRKRLEETESIGSHLYNKAEQLKEVPKTFLPQHEEELDYCEELSLLADKDDFGDEEETIPNKRKR